MLVVIWARVFLQRILMLGRIKSESSPSFQEWLLLLGLLQKNISALIFIFLLLVKQLLVPIFYPSRVGQMAAVAPQVLGRAHSTLGMLQTITAGTFSVTFGGVTHNMTGVSFAQDASFAAVAARLQTAVQAYTAGGAIFTMATVTYDPIFDRFVLTGGATGDVTVSIASGTTNDVAGPIGWINPAVISNGSDTQEVAEVLTASVQTSNNFGSFSFIAPLTQGQVVEAATWNNAQNVLFQFHYGVLPADASTFSTALVNFAGTGLTLRSPTVMNEFPEMIPMAALGATDYTRPNSTINYMYIQANVTPTVTTDADANIYDNIRVNYYGNTQTAGRLLNFYQRGLLMGQAQDPRDMNTYANEQWLKDAMTVNIMSLLVNVKVSANEQGRGQALAVIRPIITMALSNGTISPGKQLTSVQRVFVRQLTNDEQAYQQVQTLGYWLNATIAQVNSEFQVRYVLAYAKDDVVRKVEGTHVLI